MWVSEKPETVCVECVHVVQDGKALCHAVKSNEGFSTVTGKPQYRFPYRDCESANDGNCTYFEPKV